MHHDSLQFDTVDTPAHTMLKDFFPFAFAFSLPVSGPTAGARRAHTFPVVSNMLQIPHIWGTMCETTLNI